MRHLSLRVTRLLIPTGVTPNTVTALMLPAGLLAAFFVSLGNVWAAVLGVLLVQAQLLLDCADGELARWRRSVSPRGIYLDQIAHYATEAALPAALGVRADGGWDSIGGWTAIGLGIATLILFLKAETHLLQLARLRAGRPAVASDAERETSRSWLRQGARLLPYFRPFHAVEAAFLALVAAIVDAAAGELIGSRLLVGALAVAAIVAVAGHLAAILTSNRLASGATD
jgi:phosphatidylglycerophosphate synthase